MSERLKHISVAMNGNAECLHCGATDKLDMTEISFHQRYSVKLNGFIEKHKKCKPKKRAKANPYFYEGKSR